MWFYSVAILCAFSVHQAISQNEYRVIHEKIVIVDYNKKYITDPAITLFNYNETDMAYNGSGTLNAELTQDLWVHLKVFQSTDGNEYKLYPVKFSINLCEAQKKDTFGTREIFKYSNLTDCPFKPGFYYVSNYRPDERKFPPYAPRGKLIVEGKVYDKDIYLGSGRWYGTVQNI